MIEERLKNLKEEYIGTNIPSFLVYDGWVNVRLKLTERRRNLAWVFAGRLGLAGLFLALVSMVAVTSSQAASPGDILYPVKVVSQDIYSKISGDIQRPIENRTEDVVGSIAGPSENLDEAIKSYENAITNSKNRIRDEESKQQFRQILEAQEEKLRSSSEDNDDEHARDKIEELIEKTSEVKGEVKGEREGSDENEREETSGSED